ncbi:reducing polyketide synthase FUB1-like [Diaphorina citri]|uniref:Reducing polyketide synthase FUB1-like n=1 Tax=Diaphorina citri TaxID=121845 RepID=A0A3Q0J1G9_DIACI|nr:reducing polyketide synthase FUB1-like [Diaphorina citri]
MSTGQSDCVSVRLERSQFHHRQFMDRRYRSVKASSTGHFRGESGYCHCRSIQPASQCKPQLSVPRTQSHFARDLSLDLTRHSLVECLHELLSESESKSWSGGLLEADGSAIKSLDTLELNIISQLFCQNRTSALKVGSVKSNIGHSEGASALMSMVKALMAMNTSVIAPNINFETPNPNIDQRVKSLDTLELNIISQLFCQNRTSALKVGSVKSNIGHSEGASASFFSL